MSPFEEPPETSAPFHAYAEMGIPQHEHNQWTIGGEIERVGAWVAAGAKAR